jgi:cytidylate kinase
LRLGIDPDSTEEVARLAAAVRLEVDDAGVFVDGADATVEIRGPEVTRAVSAVAANQEVRAELRRRQREWAAAHGGGVIEGRDIGSVVFPDAELKLYLDASVETRARRRYKELADLDYEAVAAAIAERDARDQGRAHAAGEMADAVHIDTTDKAVDDIVEEILAMLT